jgi:hypothetical protein
MLRKEQHAGLTIDSWHPGNQYVDSQFGKLLVDVIFILFTRGKQELWIFRLTVEM